MKKGEESLASIIKATERKLKSNNIKIHTHTFCGINKIKLELKISIDAPFRNECCMAFFKGWKWPSQKTFLLLCVCLWGQGYGFGDYLVWLFLRQSQSIRGSVG